MVSFKWDNERAIQIAKEEYLAIGEERGEARGEARGIAIGEERGEAKGIKKGLIQAVVGLLQNNAPLSLITASTNLTTAEVEQIAKENGLAL